MTPEILLRKLLKHFYTDANGNIAWRYVEGTSLRDVDKEEFQAMLAPYLPQAERADFFNARGPYARR